MLGTNCLLVCLKMFVVLNLVFVRKCNVKSCVIFFIGSMLTDSMFFFEKRLNDLFYNDQIAVMKWQGHC